MFGRIFAPLAAGDVGATDDVFQFIHFQDELNLSS
jgi:hypothetical protein